MWLGGGGRTLVGAVTGVERLVREGVAEVRRAGGEPGL